jgi:hypothetical protein
MRNGEISAIEVPRDQETNFSSAEKAGQLTGIILALQKNHPATAALANLVDARPSELFDVMEQNKLTPPEALAAMGKVPYADFPTDPALENRFITHPTAYRTGGAYADFAEQTAAVATDFYKKGVPSEAVSKFVAESKQHFQIQRMPDRRVPEFNHKHDQRVNPTVFVQEVNQSSGGHANYRTAAQGALDHMERHADKAQLLPFRDGDAPANTHQLIEKLNVMESEGAFTGGAVPGAVTPDMIGALRSRLFQGDYDQPILNGQMVRMPMETPHGAAGAIYATELEKAPTTAGGSPRYSVEVLLDQGTGAAAPNGKPLRDEVTRQTHRDIDGLMRGATGQATPEQLQQLAGAWYDLTATSGNWTGGGAGTNHILAASAYETLTGQKMPGLSGPADLYAMNMTRDEFQQFFMSGDLFRNGGDALRAAGVDPGPKLPFQPPSFGGGSQPPPAPSGGFGYRR